MHRHETAFPIIDNFTNQSSGHPRNKENMHISNVSQRHPWSSHNFFKFKDVSDMRSLLPCFFIAALACPTASQGVGMSRKTASATPVTPNPSLHTSWFLTVTRCFTRCSSNSSTTFSARCWWNSTVCRWPVGAIVRKMAWEREPLPVPGKPKNEGEKNLNSSIL